jgi:hypothetical protein
VRRSDLDSRRVRRSAFERITGVDAITIDGVRVTNAMVTKSHTMAELLHKIAALRLIGPMMLILAVLTLFKARNSRGVIKPRFWPSEVPLSIRKPILILIIAHLHYQ